MSRNKTIAVVGTFDTKGKELSYIKNVIESLGADTLCIDTGIFETDFDIDITCGELAREVDADIHKLRERNDRGENVDTQCRALEKLLPRLYAEDKIDAAISAGGSGGTSIVAPAFRALPIGVPKIIVSTMAASSTGHTYIGESDLILIPSIVDVAGLNSISTQIYDNAAKAIVGMASLEHENTHENKPLIAATMFGNTTPAVNYAREYMEEQGYEVLVFHATGSGGKTMEHLIDQGFFDGVLDITTTEWNDELFGGVLAAGPNRLESAGKLGVPQIVSVGAIDEINFGHIDTLPEAMKSRNIYKHNPMVTLVRTTPEENKAVGEKIAEKLNMSNGPTVLIYPLKGNGYLSEEGMPFYDAEADAALLQALRDNLDPEKVTLIELDTHINNKEFGEACAKKLLELLGK